MVSESPESKTVENLRVLVLEPFYGGSHRAFIDGLVENLPCRFDLLTLPPRMWKWRMRFAAPFFAEQLAGKKYLERMYDLVLCSSFVDVAVFRALSPVPVRSLPCLTYFHENQFVYPVQEEDERDLHFAITNMTSALASDAVAFNSRYNKDTFLAGCRDLLSRCPDMRFASVIHGIEEKVSILPPPIDVQEIDRAKPVAFPAGSPIILWNHRWEHDKNPEEFFAVLCALDLQGVDFRIVVLGESFRETPAVFAKAREQLAKRILHWGYVASRQEYCSLLKSCDIVVSTALHEFFGLSVLEAVRAGCRPLLPSRLSYPELFSAGYLYDQGELIDKLHKSLTNGRLAEKKARDLTDLYSWEKVLPCYLEWLSGKERNNRPEPG